MHLPYRTQDILSHIIACGTAPMWPRATLGVTTVLARGGRLVGAGHGVGRRCHGWGIRRIVALSPLDDSYLAKDLTEGPGTSCDVAWAVLLTSTARPPSKRPNVSRLGLARPAPHSEDSLPCALTPTQLGYRLPTDNAQARKQKATS